MSRVREDDETGVTWDFDAHDRWLSIGVSSTTVDLAGGGGGDDLFSFAIPTDEFFAAMERLRSIAAQTPEEEWPPKMAPQPWPRE